MDESDSESEELNSSGSDEDCRKLVREYEETLEYKVFSVYPPLEHIQGIENEMVEMRVRDDQDFVDQLKDDPYLLKTMDDMFTNAEKHEWVYYDESKRSAIMTVTRDLERRADYCVVLVDEIKKGDYNLTVVEDAVGVVFATAKLLSKFVLTREEETRDLEKRVEENRKETETLLFSHFNKLTNAYKIVDQRREMLDRIHFALAKVTSTETTVPDATNNDKVQSIDAKKMPPPVVLNQQTSEESVDQHQGSQSSIVTTSTYLGTPRKK